MDRAHRTLERQALAGNPEAKERLRRHALREAVRLHYARLDVPCTEWGLAHRFDHNQQIGRRRHSKPCKACRRYIHVQWVWLPRTQHVRIGDYQATLPQASESEGLVFMIGDGVSFRSDGEQWIQSGGLVP